MGVTHYHSPRSGVKSGLSSRLKLKFSLKQAIICLFGYLASPGFARTGYKYFTINLLFCQGSNLLGFDGCLRFFQLTILILLGNIISVNRFNLPLLPLMVWFDSAHHDSYGKQSKIRLFVVYSNNFVSSKIWKYKLSNSH